MGHQIFGLSLLLTLLGHTLAQDANCDFMQKVTPGKTYYVYSPNYPNSYNKGSQCRWVADCPNGYNCHLNCNEINMPQSNNCALDRLLVSKTGDVQLTGAETYCGRGTLTADSVGQRLSVGLISTRNSTGGRFSCSLRAQPAAPPPNHCSCGYRKANRIVGGQETGVNEYPMMAGIVDQRIDQIACGAVIINEHYLITAAHCTTIMPRTAMAVVVGEHNVNAADSPATQTLKVSDILVHPRYNPNNYDDYDIGLLLTDGNIRFSDRVGPACLPFKFAANTLEGAKVKVLGWGTLFPGGPISDALQGVQLDVISQASCRAQYATVTPRQLCTFTPGKDACQFDSGGPVLYTDPETGLIYAVGVVSFGKFCASGQPGVNTRITEFLDWIVASTPDAQYCRGNILKNIL